MTWQRVEDGPQSRFQGPQEISIVEIQHVRVLKAKTGVLLSWSALVFWAALAIIVIVGPAIDAYNDPGKMVL